MYLTIQKPYYVDRLSVTSFAATLKPNVSMVQITSVGSKGLRIG
jgi:hypothetical protein